MNYIFDPLQFKYFGQEYIEGENFSCRYQFTKRFPFNSLYVPLGPLCRNAEGVHEALKSLENFKRTRIVIDLP
ncbi:MAG TPA: hypothetical protein ENN64_00940, partial [bacterium]|nr:hypothetical protein [bacterium]